jgi:type VI secretion system secreted protein Hcp
MAVVDFFLKIDGIQGESHDAKHKNEIELSSFSWAENQTGTQASGGGGGAGKVRMADFRFTMRVCKASPKLMLACANGEHINKAVLTCRKAGKEQQEYLKFTFTDVLISSYQVGGPHEGVALPSAQVSFNYGKIEMEYREQKTDGTLAAPTQAGWDLKANIAA